MGASRGSNNHQTDPPIRKEPTYNVDADDLTVGLLDLSELHQEVPETRLCNNSVWGKNSHSVQLWRWVCLGWQVAANDLVFIETTYKEKLC